MLRLIALMLALAACSDDPTPHDIVSCDSTWNGRTTGCERACETMPANFGGTGLDMPCDATHPDLASGATFRCDRTFEFEGTRGCCVDNGPLPLRFFECQ